MQHYNIRYCLNVVSIPEDVCEVPPPPPTGKKYIQLLCYIDPLIDIARMRPAFWVKVAQVLLILSLYVAFWFRVDPVLAILSM